MEALEALREGGADFAVLSRGTTPLHEAAHRGYARACATMCAPPSNCPRVNPNAQNAQGDAPLTVAAREGHLAALLALLKAGADPHGGYESANTRTPR